MLGWLHNLPRKGGNMIQWLRRGALGIAAGLSVLAVPTAAFAYGPGASNSFTNSLSTSVGTAGASVTVSAASGPCTPGGPAPISLIRAVPAQTPATLGSTTTNGSGGLDATTVVIPTVSPVGVYIMFSTCAGGGGAIDVFTSAFVVDGPILAGATGSYTPAASVTLSPHWGTAAIRAAVQPALTAAAAQAATTLSYPGSGTATGSSAGSGTATGSSAGSGTATGSSAGSAGTTGTNPAARHLLAAGTTRPVSHNGQPFITWLIVAAVVVGLATTGLLVLRRRRPASH
jgi:hypothetical protein